MIQPYEKMGNKMPGEVMLRSEVIWDCVGKHYKVQEYKIAGIIDFILGL